MRIRGASGIEEESSASVTEGLQYVYDQVAKKYLGLECFDVKDTSFKALYIWATVIL